MHSGKITAFNLGIDIKEEEIGRLLKAAFPPVKASPEFKEKLLARLIKEAGKAS